jgi:hypothetical protein
MVGWPFFNGNEAVDHCQVQVLLLSNIFSF